MPWSRCAQANVCFCLVACICAFERQSQEWGSNQQPFSSLICTILYYTILYYTILYYTILYYTILYYTILYYTILYYTILYYTIHTILCITLHYITLNYITLMDPTWPIHELRIWISDGRLKQIGSPRRELL